MNRRIFSTTVGGVLLLAVVGTMFLEVQWTETFRAPKSQGQMGQMLWNGGSQVPFPSVAVIIPFNKWARRDALLQSIRSIVDQTYQGHLETIVVDTSMDPRAEELDKISFQRPVRIIHVQPPKDTWAGFPRNVGIHAAKDFEYVAFQDSDDVWFRNKLELQFQFMNVFNSVFSTSDFVLPKRCRQSRQNGATIWRDWSEEEMMASPIGNGGEYRTWIGSQQGSLIKDGAYIPAMVDIRLMEFSNLASTSSVVIKRSVLIDNNLLFDEKISDGKEDWELWKRIMRVAKIEMGYLSRPTFALDRVCHGGLPTAYQKRNLR